MRDLGYRNVHAVEPLGFALDGHQKVIKIHDCVDGEVHGAKDNARGCLGNVAVPAIRQHRNVVVPVQQDEWLFVNEDEIGVDEFSVIAFVNVIAIVFECIRVIV